MEQIWIHSVQLSAVYGSIIINLKGNSSFKKAVAQEFADGEEDKHQKSLCFCDDTQYGQL